MRQLPFGYEIKDGKITVNESQAEALKAMSQNYINGMSLLSCAREIGIQKDHHSIMKILTNKTYAGNTTFPRILSNETINAIIAERARRAKALGRNNLPKHRNPIVIEKEKYTIGKVPTKFKDPIRQAEYAYSLIRKEKGEK